MIILPARERFIKDNFFEFSFEDKEPDFEKFKTLNSDEQFYLAEIYNWDDGTKVLNWIIESPKCDKGTASMIFGEVLLIIILMEKMKFLNTKKTPLTYLIKLWKDSAIKILNIRE